ncbi:hypothetical protein LX73_0278 [Fodinibius salinus]|uniref:DUF3098 domain-containing protein n=1 Tax=Fodinibius salinus TaxID=860790 RepID=A0A5D3YM08_9BACT|nr:hypothetical protein [Fodinibius salinus]TYP94984.1 hypothetical protein LX73_0278 [Fodinibius salinus]
MASKKHRSSGKNRTMIFSAWNYKMLALGMFLVLAGFLAMYAENEVEGIISLYISPIVIMAGYISVIIAILKHDDGSSAAQSES